MTACILDIETIYEGRSSLRMATVRHPSGDEFKRSIEDHGPAVSILPYDPQRRVALLVEQVRAGVLYGGGTGLSLEAPAGLRENDEPPEECGRREVMEEAGVRLGAMEHIGAPWTMPGFSSERIDLYLAAYSVADKIAAGGGLADEHEHITVVELPIDELVRRADAGEVGDMKTMLLALALARRHPELLG